MSTTLGALAAASRGPVDNDAIARSIAEQSQRWQAERAKEPKKLNLQHLSVLQREIGDLKFRLEDQERRVPQLANTVANIEQQVADLRKAKKRLTDMGDVVNVWPQLQQLDKRLARLEPELKDERRRLECATNLVASYTKLIDEWWASANGEELKALNKLDAAIEQAMPTQRSTRGMFGVFTP